MDGAYFINPLDHTKERAEKPYKHSFLETERMLAGLNCVLPGQGQKIHKHPEQDKFYLVLEGKGLFTVGDTEQECGEGMLILAPAGIAHGVENRGSERLTFLTVIAPF